MQRNPQPPSVHRQAARPQQNNHPQGQRPIARPVQQPASGRPAQSGINAQAAGRQAARPSVRQTTVSSGRPAPAPQARVPSARAVGSARPSAPVQKASPFTGRKDTRPLLIAGISAVFIMIIGCLMQYVLYPYGYFPGKAAEKSTAVAEISSSRGVRINEVMTSNKTAMSDDEGSYPDWIELINSSNTDINISGWSLLDKASRSTYFTFPEYILRPGETVIVFASGHLSNEISSSFHAPFRLSSAGDTLMLSDANNTVVESINIPALGANQSYAQKDGTWTITSEYTPGAENTSLNFAALTSTQPAVDSSLVITEIMADNASVKASDGEMYDWIEIQNTGSESVDLKGYALSDSASSPSKWKFPSVVLQPGQCLVIYASGLNQQTADGDLHTSFGLRAEGESVLLYSPSGQVLDYVEFDNLKTNQAIRRQSDGTYTISGTVSPGQAN